MGCNRLERKARSKEIDKFNNINIENKASEIEKEDYIKWGIDEKWPIRAHAHEWPTKKWINEIYRYKTIYIIHYPKGIEAQYSVDTIININDNHQIKHCCTTDHGPSGAPILNLPNYHVLGIHIGNNKNKKFNVGEIPKLAIDDFNIEYKHIKNNNKSLIENKKEYNKVLNKENYIVAEIEIKEEDINKDIRIINSFEQCKREYKWKDNKEDKKLWN